MAKTHRMPCVHSGEAHRADAAARPQGIDEAGKIPGVYAVSES